MRMMAGVWVSVLLGVLAVAAPPAHGDTYAVNSSADAVDAAPGNGTCATAGGACTLRAAVQEANAHAGADVITLPAGVYYLSLIGAGEDLGATGDLDVTEALEVNGAGLETTVIDGVSSDRIFQASGAFALRDVTLRRASMDVTGTAVFLPGAAARTVERVLVVDTVGTTGGSGGALAQLAGDLTLTDARFERNVTAGPGGGLLFAGAGNLSVTRSTFVRNVADTGGAIFATTTGTVTIADSSFSENLADAGGGVFAANSSSGSVTGSSFEGNVGASAFGGLFVAGTTSVVVSGTSIVGNLSSSFGGAYLASGGTVQVTGGEASDNVGAGAFGGMFVTASTGVTVEGTAFRRNSGGGGPGGGLYLTLTAGTVVLTDVEATENAGNVGGGLYVVNANGPVTASRVRVTNNGSGPAPGGGMFVSASGGAVAVADSTFAGNVAASVGGGLYVASPLGLMLQGSTISGNRSAGVAGLGGGAFVAVGTASAIVNSTFSGNVADAAGGGLYSAGDFTIRNTTFAGDESPVGSAVFNSGGTVTPVGTIVAGTAASHCGGVALTSGGNNIDSNGTCGLAGLGDQAVDPQLGPLADNGGPTFTHLPAATSPALDAGAAAGCPASDQRAQARPADGNGDGIAACDVGAVEFLDLCLDDPAKVLPGVCGCGVPDMDADQANGTADCLVNGELKARVARAKAIVAALAGDADPLEAELSTIGDSLPAYVSANKAQIQLMDPKAKVDKLARKARKKIKKVGKAKTGSKLDKAKTKATTALDGLDAAVAPQA